MKNWTYILLIIGVIYIKRCIQLQTRIINNGPLHVTEKINHQSQHKILVHFQPHPSVPSIYSYPCLQAFSILLRIYILFQPFFLYFLNLTNSTNVNKQHSTKILELRYKKVIPLNQLKKNIALCNIL